MSESLRGATASRSLISVGGPGCPRPGSDVVLGHGSTAAARAAPRPLPHRPAQFDLLFQEPIAGAPVSLDRSGTRCPSSPLSTPADVARRCLRRAMRGLRADAGSNRRTLGELGRASLQASGHRAEVRPAPFDHGATRPAPRRRRSTRDARSRSCAARRIVVVTEQIGYTRQWRLASFFIFFGTRACRIPLGAPGP